MQIKVSRPTPIAAGTRRRRSSARVAANALRSAANKENAATVASGKQPRRRRSSAVAATGSSDQQSNVLDYLKNACAEKKFRVFEKQWLDCTMGRSAMRAAAQQAAEQLTRSQQEQQQQKQGRGSCRRPRGPKATKPKWQFVEEYQQWRARKSEHWLALAEAARVEIERRTAAAAAAAAGQPASTQNMTEKA